MDLVRPNRGLEQELADCAVRCAITNIMTIPIKRQICLTVIEDTLLWLRYREAKDFDPSKEWRKAGKELQSKLAVQMGRFNVTRRFYHSKGRLEHAYQMKDIMRALAALQYVVRGLISTPERQAAWFNKSLIMSGYRNFEMNH